MLGPHEHHPDAAIRQGAGERMCTMTFDKIAKLKEKRDGCGENGMTTRQGMAAARKMFGGRGGRCIIAVAGLDYVRGVARYTGS